MTVAQSLAGTESQPHAAAVLGPALPPEGRPSHAYLFHGPPGSGKRAAARAFAARLLSVRSAPGAGGSGRAGGSSGAGAGGEADRDAIAERVLRGSHPDLTWVRPTGAAEMLVSDIDEPVVAAASRTPFEASRRVFVIEGADAMNDRAANRLLKTLEEPPPFAHLILLADRREDVLPTIVSRCQLVRFDPLRPEAIAQMLLEQQGEGGAADGAGLEPGASAGAAGLTPQTAAACARLALGDAEVARELAGPQGALLRDAAQTLVAAALESEGTPAPRPWGALLDAAGKAGARAGEQVATEVQAELELLPSKERRKREREGTEAARRAERRSRTRALEIGLRLVELWLRDMLCLAQEAGELVHALDRLDALQADLTSLRRRGGDPRERLPAAIEQVTQTRLSLAQNVTEELALESLCYRLQDVLGG
jgi:DNA polymerase III subunit delta'